MDIIQLLCNGFIKMRTGKQLSISACGSSSEGDAIILEGNDLLLIKESIEAKDDIIIRNFHGNCSIFTTQPQTLEESYILRDLPEKVDIHYLESMGLEFIHCGERLYILKSPYEEKHDTPNMICIQPVYREDIDISFVGAEVKQVLMPEKNEEVIKRNNVEEKTPDSSWKSQELKLIREKVRELFDKIFTVVKVDFHGVDVARKTISLSKFYRKYNIASGRLKGSWTLFEEEELKKFSDVQIVRRAINNVYRNFSTIIPGCGRIIHSDAMKNFRDALEAIEREYILYLGGETKCNKIGGIEVKQGFAPEPFIDRSFEAMEQYLLQIKGNDLDENYRMAVKQFRRSEDEKLIFIESVKLNVSEMTFKDGQWKNVSFIYALQKCIDLNREFFEEDYEFLQLLKRYYTLLEN